MREHWMGILIAALLLGSAGTASAQEPADLSGYAESDPEAQALRALGRRLRAVEGDSRELNAEVGETYRRLATISLDVLGERTGAARVELTQHNLTGPFYRLVEATYAIDGREVFHREDPSGALGEERQLAVHQGALAPGQHVLSVVLRYRGDGRLFRYLERYRFTVRSSTTFTSTPGEHARIEARAYERPDQPYLRRLSLEVRDHGEAESAR